MNREQFGRKVFERLIEDGPTAPVPTASLWSVKAWNEALDAAILAVWKTREGKLSKDHLGYLAAVESIETLKKPTEREPEAMGMKERMEQETADRAKERPTWAFDEDETEFRWWMKNVGLVMGITMRTQVVENDETIAMASDRPVRW